MIYKRGKKYFAVFKRVRNANTNKVLKREYPNLVKIEALKDPVDGTWELGYDGTVIDDKTIAFEFSNLKEASKFINVCIEKKIVDSEFIGCYGEIFDFEFITEEEVINKVTAVNTSRYEIGKGYVNRIDYTWFTDKSNIFCWMATKDNMRVFYMDDFKRFMKDPKKYIKDEMQIQRKATSAGGVYHILDKRVSKIFNSGYYNIY